MAASKQIRSALESMMFTWGEPLGVRTAADVLNVQEADVKEAFESVELLDTLDCVGESERRIFLVSMSYLLIMVMQSYITGQEKWETSIFEKLAMRIAGLRFAWCVIASRIAVDATTAEEETERTPIGVLASSPRLAP